LHQTPLIPAHREAGAKLADFAGREMPLHYGSQLEEHHAVRRDAGMFDTSQMLANDVGGAGPSIPAGQVTSVFHLDLVHVFLGDGRHIAPRFPAI